MLQIELKGAKEAIEDANLLIEKLQEIVDLIDQLSLRKVELNLFDPERSEESNPSV